MSFRINILVFFTLFVGKIFGQNNLIYSNVIAKRQSELKLQSKVNVPKDAVFLKDFLPENFILDGSVDYTSYIQAVIDKYSRIIFPPNILKINEKGLTVKSNSILYFEEGSLLFISANNLPSYEIMRIHNVENVSIIGAKIIGDKKKHLTSKGEWGNGISIKGAKNINVYNTEVKECWGDGIYIGRLGNKSSEDITIENTFLNENRRNGVSVTSAINVRLVNLIASNTEGTNPMFGIDIEPNGNEDEIDGIEILNPLTLNNKVGGINIELYKIVGKIDKNVSIKVHDHSDLDSYYGLRIGNISDNGSLNGNVEIVNGNYKNNYTPIKYGSIKSKTFKLTFINPKILNAKRKAFTVDELDKSLKGKSSIILKR